MIFSAESNMKSSEFLTFLSLAIFPSGVTCRQRPPLGLAPLFPSGGGLRPGPFRQVRPEPNRLGQISQPFPLRDISDGTGDGIKKVVSRNS
jgi:hypothetical protein